MNESRREEQADIIIEGRIVSSEPYEKDGEIYTKTTFGSINHLNQGLEIPKDVIVSHYGNLEKGPIAISITLDLSSGANIST